MGPKPTKLQLETLTKLALPGVIAHEYSIIRGPLAAYLTYPSGDPKKSDRHETLNHGTLSKFVSWGWLRPVGDPEMAWRSMDYVITEDGLEVIKKGEIRK
jgi:hypothetical protein